MSRLRRVLLALLLVLIGLQRVALAAPYQPPAEPGPASPQGTGMGIDGMITAPDIRHGNDPMLFEKYAATDYTPINIDPGSAAIGFAQNSNLEMWNLFMNGVASAQAAALLAGGTVATRLIEWSLSLDLVTDASGPVATTVDALHLGFYNKLWPWAVGALVIMLAFLLVRGKIIRAASSVLWAIVAIVLGALLMSHPVEYAANANDFTGWASQTALNDIGKGDAAGLNRDRTTSSGPAGHAQLRAFSNRLWYLDVYQPWTEIQFGQVDPMVPGTTRQLGVELLEKKAGRGGSFDADFQQMPQDVKDWYNGDRGTERAIGGGLGVLVMAANLGLVIAIVLTIFMAALAVVALVIAVPIMSLLGMIPGFGHAAALTWVELLLKALAVKIVMSIFLALVLLLAGVLATFTGKTGWLIACFLQLGLFWVAWQHRKSFLTLGHRVGGIRSAGGAPPPPPSRPAAAAGRHLNAAQRRVAQPLTRPALQASRATPVTARAAGTGAKAATSGATKAVGSSAGKAASGGAVSIGTAGVALAGLAAVRVAQSGLGAYRAARHQVHAPAAHFLGGGSGSGSAAAGPRHTGPSLFGLAGQQVLARGGPQLRAIRGGNRLPPPQTPARRKSSTNRQPRRTQAISMNRASTSRKVKGGKTP